jgi:lactate dehydrogenase-like 2-hydroxyacid dehydrogenase
MKKTPEMNAELRSGIWNSAGWWNILGDMYHSTLGILGLGRIGSEVARRSH